MTEPFRVHVIKAGTGYLAENSALAISVGGASAVEAVEKARVVALEVLAPCGPRSLPSTLMARIDRDRSIAFVTRPFHKPFAIAPDDPDTFYLDSEGRVSS